MTRALIIYHAGCRDGFTAAWVAKLALESTHYLDFKAAQYGEPLPDLTPYDKLYILDFSYPLADMEALVNGGCDFTCLDHHKTASDSLRRKNKEGFLEILPGCHFDMSRSGAGLTWDHFHPGEPRPPLVNYVEDRDLWRFELPNSKAINTWISSIPFDFKGWDLASTLLADGALGLQHCVNLGEAILLNDLQYIQGKAAQATIRTFACHPTYTTKLVQVPIINTTHLVSEVLHELCHGQDVVATDRIPLGRTAGPPFAIGWFQNKEGKFVYSLRSSEHGYDVSEIAKAYGGGGHPHAAGFTLDRLLW